MKRAFFLLAFLFLALALLAGCAQAMPTTIPTPQSATRTPAIETTPAPPPTHPAVTPTPLLQKLVLGLE